MITVNDNCTYISNPQNNAKFVWVHDHLNTFVIESNRYCCTLTENTAIVFFLVNSPINHYLDNSIYSQVNINAQEFWTILFALLQKGLILKSKPHIRTSQPKLEVDTFVIKNKTHWVIGNVHNASLDYLHTPQAELILQNRLNDLPINLLELLHARGYITFNKSSNCSIPQAPENYLVLSYGCNLKCSYCFECNVSKNKFEMSDETLNSFLQMCSTMRSPYRIVLYGGEPLLAFSFKKIQKVINFISATPNCTLRVITNGINVIESLPLFEKIKEKVSSFTITLDGDQRIHDLRRVFKSGKGSYQVALHAVHVLTDSGFLCIVRINLDSTNYRKLDSLINDLNQLQHKNNVTISIARVENPTSMSFSPLSLSNIVESYFHIKALTDIHITSDIPILQYITQCDLSNTNKKHFFPLRTMYCDSTQINVFDTDGKIYSCNEGMGDVFFEKDGILSASNPSDKFSTKCQNCSFFPLCYGNCPRINHYNSKLGKFRCEEQEIRKSIELMCNRSEFHFIDFSIRPL